MRANGVFQALVQARLEASEGSAKFLNKIVTKHTEEGEIIHRPVPEHF